MDYYVDYDGGNDSNDGLSTSFPWRRCPGMPGFAGTPTSLSPGDTVYFKKGVIWPSSCFNFQPNWSGISGAPITFAAHPTWGTGDYPIFDLGSSKSYAFYARGPDYLIFDGFHIRNGGPLSANRGHIEVYPGSQHITVRNCFVEDVYSGGSETAGILINDDYGSVENCVINTNGANYGIFFRNAQYVTIRGNEVYNWGHHGIRGAENSHYGVIEQNYLHDARGSATMGIAYRQSNEPIVRYNIIEFSGGYGIASWTEGSFRIENARYYNNVLYGGGMRLSYMDESNGAKVYNNIFYDCPSPAIDSGDPNTSQITLGYNDFYGCSGSDCYTSGTGISFANEIYVDPKFVDPTPSSIDDYKLQSESPCIDRATSFDGYHNGINSDLFGTIVPQGASPDIGVAEYEGDGDIIPPAIPTGLLISSIGKM